MSQSRENLRTDGKSLFNRTLPAEAGGPIKSMLLQQDACFVKTLNIYNTCLWVASLTLRSLPFSGNTPYLSRPTMLSPAIAKALAESPSVTINVQSREYLVPASLASSSFGTPFKRLCLDELLFLLSWASLLNFTNDIMLSRTPQFWTYNKNMDHK